MPSLIRVVHLYLGSQFHKGHLDHPIGLLESFLLRCGYRQGLVLCLFFPAFVIICWLISTLVPSLSNDVNMFFLSCVDVISCFIILYRYHGNLRHPPQSYPHFLGLRGWPYFKKTDASSLSTKPGLFLVGVGFDRGKLGFLGANVIQLMVPKLRLVVYTIIHYFQGFKKIPGR